MTTPDTDKDFDIIVNGTNYPVPNDEVSFDQAVDLAYPDGGRGPLITYTVDLRILQRCRSATGRQADRRPESQSKGRDRLQCHTH